MNTAESLAAARQPPLGRFLRLQDDPCMRIAPTGTLVPVNTASRLSVTDDVLMVEITGK